MSRCYHCGIGLGAGEGVRVTVMTGHSSHWGSGKSPLKISTHHGQRLLCERCATIELEWPFALAAVLISAGGLGWLGYSQSGKPLMVVTAVIGAAIGVVLNKPMRWLLQRVLDVVVILVVIALLVGFAVFIFQVIPDR